MKKVAFTLTLALLSITAFAQVPAIKNPSAIIFTSADHDNAAVTGYEIDILNGTTNALVQTLNIAKTATTKLPTGEIRVNVNVQPVAFGSYTFVARTIAGAIESVNSVESDLWERVPGAPSKPISQ